jgi:hypothetical protein
VHRPNEVLRDDWEAVGLGEMEAALRSQESTPQAVLDVWDNREAIGVDLQRLAAYRGKNLHAVGPPSGQVGDSEMAAVILRLRIGFERVRRDLADTAGDWWPYIAAMSSNIPLLCFERTSLPLCRGPSSVEFLESAYGQSGVGLDG